MIIPPKMKIDLCKTEEGRELYQEIADFVSDYISERTGFLHNGFELDVQITANNIMYDTDEEDETVEEA